MCLQLGMAIGPCWTQLCTQPWFEGERAPSARLVLFEGGRENSGQLLCRSSYKRYV